MNEYKRPERAAARQQARKWDAASSACIVAASLLLWAGEALSRYLSPRIGIDAGTLRLAFLLLPMVWIGVMVFCSVRGKEMRRVAEGEKLWREQKQDMEAEAARAEAYLGIEKRRSLTSTCSEAQE